MANPIVKGIKKYIPVFKEAKDRDLNEADVVTRIVKFLEDVLGYDVLKHITKEHQIKERYVDLAIKINDKVKFYIEAKAANTNLKESHIFQAESYASQSGLPWVILTNGSEWHLFHLTFDKTGIEHTLVFNINLLGDDVVQSAEKLYYLSYQAMKGDEIEKYWEKFLSLHSSSIVRALFHETTLTAIRREVRRKSGVIVDEDEIVESIRKLLSDRVLSKHGDIIKIGRRRRAGSKDKSIPETELGNSTEQKIDTSQSMPLDNNSQNTENQGKNPEKQVTQDIQVPKNNGVRH